MMLITWDEPIHLGNLPLLGWVVKLIIEETAEEFCSIQYAVDDVIGAVGDSHSVHIFRDPDRFADIFLDSFDSPEPTETFHAVVTAINDFGFSDASANSNTVVYNT